MRGTNGITLYKVPGSKLTLADLPGCGDVRFPTATYVPDMGIAAFDALVLFITNRVPDVLRDVAEAARRQFPRQRLLVVATHGDVALKNLQ
mgnify:CR=1 FL=1